MHPERWPHVTDLMHRALDVPEVERRAWIEAQAAGDAEIVAEVVRLLDAHVNAGRFLEDPLIARPGAATELHDALSGATGGMIGVGTSLGHYRILREIGHGGMGTVYLGARADDVFEKQVAIKVVSGAFVGHALQESFSRERQLLATLDHPGIARVLDGGATANGLQFLVMEYVDGTPIDAYCDARQLGTHARLRLFLEVCRAVHYAHGRLIVHRDIKASNVLVGEDGRPKLLDFGIAKLLAQEESPGDPSATLVRAWTPESASPEQVRGEPTTIATDVYGLGALLYRLLTGRPVFDLSGRDHVDRARVICEATPERPSVAAARTPGRTKALAVADDVDMIVIEALHKEPSRRYRSAEHLAEDIERHLAHRPVLAAPDSWKYRARKFIGRHPAATAASMAAVVAVLAATAAALWQARRADRERERAQARLTDVRRLANTLIFDVYDRVENSPNATPIRRTLVEKGLESLDRVAPDGASDPTLSLELADAYRRLAEVQGTPGKSNLGDRDGAARSLEKGRSMLAPFLARADPPVAIEVSYLNLTRQLALTLAGDPDRARQLTVENLERAKRLQKRHPDDNTVTEAVASTYFYAALSRPDNQLDLWSEAHRLYQALNVRVPGNPVHLRSLALTSMYIGTFHGVAKRYELARTNFERALELDRQVQKLRPDDRKTTIDVAVDLGNLASLASLAVPPALAEAIALYRESLALREQAVAQDPRDVFARQALGFCLTELCNLSRRSGDVDAAVGYGQRAVDAYEALPPSEQLMRRGNAWFAFGRALSQAGRRTEGCAALRRALQYFKQASVVPSSQRGVPEALTSVGEALAACRP